MFPTEIVSIAVAAIAAGGAWASQRASSKAATVSTRMDAEKEAYERARAFDLQTIERQQEEIKVLRERLAIAESKLDKMEEHNPISLLGLEGLLRDRIKDEQPTDPEQ